MDVTADRLIVDVLARTDKMERDFRRVDMLGQQVAGRISNAFKGALALLGAGSAVAMAQTFLKIADGAKMLEAQLRLATAQSGNFAQAQEDVRRIAEATRSSLSSTADLYGTFTRNAHELGISQSDAARATETFAKAAAISGKGAAASSAALTQFSQALASGVLRGDEFNSIMENAPRLAALLAESIGVPTGALRKMAEAGELGADKLTRALTDQRFTAGIDAEFRQLPVTFEQAMGQVENAATIVFGAFDRGGEFSAALANFVMDGTDGFADLEASAENLGIEIRSVFAGLANAFDPMVEGARDAFGQIGLEAETLHNVIADAMRELQGIGNFGARWLEGAKNFWQDVGSAGTAGLIPPSEKGAFNSDGSLGRFEFGDNYLKGQGSEEARLRARSTWRQNGIDPGFARYMADPSRYDMAGNPRNRPARARGGTGPGKARPRGRSGPSAETLAKRAEAEQQAEERRAEGFRSELSGLNRDLLAARSALAASAEIRAEFERQEIELARAEYAAGLASQVTQKKLTEAEAEQLSGINDQIAAQRVALVDQQEAARKRQLAAEQAQYGVDASLAENRDRQDLLQSQASLAETLGDRRDIELRLVDLQFEEERIRLNSIIAESERLNAIKDATDAEKDAARTAQAAADLARQRLGILPELQGNARAGVERANEGPMATWRRQAAAEAADLNTTLERLEVDAINRATDGFGELTAKILGAKGAVGDLIAELAKLAFRQAVLALLPGGGGLGGLIPGFASGGSMILGGRGGRDREILQLNGRPIARVTRGERMDIVPQGRAIRPVSGAIMRQAPPVIRNFNIHVSADNSVTPQGFARELAGKILQEAQRMDAAVATGVLKAVPARMGQYSTDGI